MLAMSMNLSFHSIYFIKKLGQNENSDFLYKPQAIVYDLFQHRRSRLSGKLQKRLPPSHKEDSTVSFHSYSDGT